MTGDLGESDLATTVLYVDEAGSTERYDTPLRDGQTPIFALSGVALPLTEWREIDREYLNLKRRFFAKEMAQTKAERPEHWEAKGGDLASPRNKTSVRRHAFITEVLALLRKYDARLFAVTFIKTPGTPVSSIGLYTSAMQQLAARFNCYVAEHSDFRTGLIITDSRCRSVKGQDFRVGCSYLSYVFGHETGTSLTTLVEAPLFADSRLTAGLQLADNMASLIYGTQYHHYVHGIPGGHDYSHLHKYWERLSALRFASEKTYDGYKVYGFRVNGESPCLEPEGE